MKKLSVLLICLAIFSLLLSGCAKCINVEYNDVEVTIVGAYHQPSRILSVCIGKTVVPIRRPDIYQITVEYGGRYYKFDDIDIYNKYDNMIGQTIKAKSELKTYDDGSTQYRIASIY